MVKVNPDHNPAYVIFHYYFEVYIPQHYLYTDAYIQKFGLPTSGDMNIDRSLAESSVLSMQTIGELAELYADGASITFKDPSDSVVVYKVINAHLNDWHEKVRKSIMGVNPPLEDLNKLNDLALELAPLASVYTKQEPNPSMLANQLETLGAGLGSLGKPVISKPNPSGEKKEYSESPGTKVLDFITKSVYQQRLPNK